MSKKNLIYKKNTQWFGNKSERPSRPPITLAIGLADSKCFQCTPSSGLRRDAGIPWSSLSTMPPNIGIVENIFKMREPKVFQPGWESSIQTHFQPGHTCSGNQAANVWVILIRMLCKRFCLITEQWFQNHLPKKTSTKFSLFDPFWAKSFTACAACRPGTTKWYKKVRNPSTDFFPIESSTFFMPFMWRRSVGGTPVATWGSSRPTSD